MQNIFTFTLWNVYESTSNYWPGFSDTGTASALGVTRDKISKIQNRELKKLEKVIVVPKQDRPGEPAGYRTFLNKWMYANMIMTSLQQGFKINTTLIKKAYRYYKELLDDPNLNVYMSQSKYPNMFPETIEIIIKKINLLLNNHTDKYVYKPGFLDYSDEDRRAIDRKYTTVYEKKYIK